MLRVLFGNKATFDLIGGRQLAGLLREVVIEDLPALDCMNLRDGLCVYLPNTDIEEVFNLLTLLGIFYKSDFSLWPESFRNERLYLRQQFCSQLSCALVVSAFKCEQGA